MHLTNKEPIRICGLAAAGSPEAAGAPENEIEITPEMVEAGVSEFVKFDRRFDDEEDAVGNIYIAMEKVRIKAGV